MKERVIPPENLICPNCQSTMTFTEPVYTCSVCGSTFPVEDGIFNFLPEDLETNKLNEEKLWAGWWDFDLRQVKGEEMKYFCDVVLDAHIFEGRVLEVGAGSCWLSSLLKLKHPNVEAYASDVSISGLRRGVEISRFLGSKIDFFVACDAERLPFKSGFFDCVCGNAVIHHLLDTRRGIAEIQRVLKRGGKYVGSKELMANTLIIRLWGSRFFGAGKRGSTKGIKENIFTLREWLSLFMEGGFKHTNIKLDRDWRFKTKERLFNYLYYRFTSVFPESAVKVFLASSIDVTATK